MQISDFIRVLAVAALGSPLYAVEPPVESQPIHPRNVPDERDAKEREIPLREARPKPQEVRDLVVAQRPYLGVILDPVPQLLASHLKLGADEGVVVGEVLAGGPAELAGMRVSDVITKVGGKPVGSPEDVREAVEERAVGDRVQVEGFHEGEAMSLAVELGAAPETMPAPPMAEDDEIAFGNPGWEELPERHADIIREAMERNLRAFEELEEDPDAPGMIQRDLLRRLQRGFQGMDIGGIGGFRAESSIRLLDEDGSIEVKNRNGQKNARVFDRNGDLLWEGPYETEEDRAAVPEDIRERLNRVDLDLGNGIRLRFGAERFRRLEDLDIEPGGSGSHHGGEEIR